MSQRKQPQGGHQKVASQSLPQRYEKVLLNDPSSLPKFGVQVGHEAGWSDTVVDGVAFQPLVPGVGASNLPCSRLSAA